MKPLTYMNLSGGAVADFVADAGLSKRDVIVYYDDIALPLGTIRIRERGSDGGHRGLASILEALESQDVARVRIGIHPRTAPPEDLARFVLEPFDGEEQPVVDEVMRRVVEATRTILRDGTTKAMSRYNSITA
jgi:PTH1 family peptidyl-tRNA hydrolase